MLKHILFALTVVFFLTDSAKAQTEDIRFEHINVQDGLTDFMIFYIYQDVNGFMWFSEALQRYDGRNLKSYSGGIYEIRLGELLRGNWGREPDSLIYFDPFRDSVVVNLPKRLWFLMAQQTNSFLRFGCPDCFVQDSVKRIWFGSSTDGIFIYQPVTKSFQNLRHQEGRASSLSSNKVSTVLKDLQGRIWAGTWDGGLNLWEKDSTFRHFRFEAKNPNSLSSDTITCLKEDRQGLIWIGTPNGLNCINPNTHKITRVLFPSTIAKRIRKFFITNTGKVWVGAQRLNIEKAGFPCVVLFDPVTNTVQEHFTLEIYWNNRIFSMVEDHLGRTWMGDIRGGVYIYDPTTRKLAHFYHDPQNPKSISSNAIRQLYRDKDNRIWVGSFNGINIYDPNTKVFNHLESDKERKTYFNSEQKHSILEDHQGNIWIATRGQGLIKRNPQTAEIKIYLPKRDILKIVEDDKGNIWITDFERGLLVLNAGSGKITQLSNMVNISGITKDTKGSIWVGGSEGLLVYSSPDSKPTFIAWSSLKDSLGKPFLNLPDNPLPSSLIEGCGGNIWISGNFPLIRLKPTKHLVEQFFYEPNDPNSVIPGSNFYFSTDKDCNLWFCSPNGGGMACLTLDQQNAVKPKFRRWHTGNSAMPHDKIQDIRAISNGRICFSSPKGVTFYDPIANTFKTYGKEEGMKTQPISLFQSKDGTIYIGGMNGIGYFNPEKLVENIHIPPIFLTDIQLNGLSLPLKGSPGDTLTFPSPLQQSISFAKSISLKYGQNEISLSFSALNYTAHDNSKYKYQLIGYDKDWKETDASQPFASYTNLNPGTYTFRITGSNNDGVWNEKAATLEIIIRPPWWRTWWAFMFYIILIGGSVFYIYRFQLNHRLEQAEAVRLKELDAVKTRLYTNITHEFRTPLTVILGMARQIFDRPKEQVQSDGMPLAEASQMIIRNGQNLLNLVNQMLDLSKLESGKLALHYQQSNIVNFLKYIVESFHSLAENKGVKIHFHSEEEALMMDFDEMRLQQVVSNLLSNAIKFTPKDGHIYMSIIRQNNTLVIQIKDTGIGIAEADLPHIFDRFYQVDDSHTRHGEGTGIGLTLTRELVKLMEGDITVKSYPNKGTEFKVTLPIRHLSDISEGIVMEKEGNDEVGQLPEGMLMAQAVQYEKVDAVSTNENASAIVHEYVDDGKPHVLIADDNADVRAYLMACLGTDYHLIIAQDGKECENIAFENIPDLIILDVMMPFKDGFEVCKTLKTDERTSHIPIIMLTAKADMDSKLQGLERGADAYLMKPFHKEELLLRIKKLLELRQQLQQHYLLAISDVGFQISDSKHPNPKSDIQNPKYTEGVETSYGEEKTLLGLEHAFVIKVKKTIEAHLNDYDFDVEKLSRALALSHSQVHRKLSALTGVSPTSFMRYVRLLKAKELLLNSGFNIASIAYDCGFNDPAYFSRIFKQTFGETPQVWREQHLL